VACQKPPTAAAAAVAGTSPNTCHCPAACVYHQSHRLSPLRLLSTAPTAAAAAAAVYPPLLLLLRRPLPAVWVRPSVDGAAVPQVLLKGRPGRTAAARGGWGGGLCLFRRDVSTPPYQCQHCTCVNSSSNSSSTIAAAQRAPTFALCLVFAGLHHTTLHSPSPSLPALHFLSCTPQHEVKLFRDCIGPTTTLHSPPLFCLLLIVPLHPTA
jgi:hypothetical protein